MNRESLSASCAFLFHDVATSATKAESLDYDIIPQTIVRTAPFADFSNPRHEWPLRFDLLRADRERFAPSSVERRTAALGCRQIPRDAIEVIAKLSEGGQADGICSVSS